MQRIKENLRKLKNPVLGSKICSHERVRKNRPSARGLRQYSTLDPLRYNFISCITPRCCNKSVTLTFCYSLRGWLFLRLNIMFALQLFRYVVIKPVFIVFMLLNLSILDAYITPVVLGIPNLQFWALHQVSLKNMLHINGSS